MAFLRKTAGSCIARGLLECTLAGLMFAGAHGDGKTPEIDEDQVKAVFLYKLAKFVEWPDGSFTSPQAPLTVCVVGNNAFADLLEGVVKGNPANGREFVVRSLTSASEARNCQIVYFAASERRRLRAALATFAGTAVLTAGETEGFAIQGCVIDFRIEADRVRFEVNIDAAARAQLKISAKLLSLAARVVKE